MTDGFDGTAAAAEVAEALKAATGLPEVRVLPQPDHVGALAFARIPASVAADVDWGAFARDVLGRTGLRPVCVEDHDLPVDGGGRIPALLVVMDVPGVDEDWRYDYANKLPWNYRVAA